MLYIGQGRVGGKESRWSRGARNRHIIDPRQLPRPPLDKPTQNHLKINGVDSRKEYEATEGEWAPWQAGRPMGWARLAGPLSWPFSPSFDVVSTRTF